jgi:predicted small secreted protein
MKKNIVLTIALSFIALSSLAACTNTVDGAGQDIEKAGENIQKTVD